MTAGPTEINRKGSCNPDHGLLVRGLSTIPHVPPCPGVSKKASDKNQGMQKTGSTSKIKVSLSLSETLAKSRPPSRLTWKTI